MTRLAPLTTLGLLLSLSCSSTSDPGDSSGAITMGTAGTPGSGIPSNMTGGSSSTIIPSPSGGGTPAVGVGSGGTTVVGVGTGGAGTVVGAAGAAVMGTGGTPAMGTGGAPMATGGATMGAGGTTAMAGSGSGGSSAVQPPMLNIDASRMNRQDINFNVTDADPTASGFHGGGQVASFDGSKTVQGYLVVTMGGIGGGPHSGGAYQWAVGRGFHAIAVDMFNSTGGEGNGGLVYLESFSGQDLTGAANVSPQNGVMNRVKTALAYLDEYDPGADWGYYLDANGDVIWDRVILFGYSYGGQTAVAATKFVAVHRVVATSAPNIPTGEASSSWITDMPNVSDVNNLYAINDSEDNFWNTLTAMGWIGPPVRIFSGGGLLVDPPFDGSHMLDMSGGHTEFCSLPNAAYDAACDLAFGVVP